MAQQLQIRNSTAEFLIFQAEDKAQGVQVYQQDEMIWATQEAIATLFDKGRSRITEHLKHIFESGELQADVVCRNFRHTTQHGAIEGKTQTKGVTFYNLDAIIFLYQLCHLSRSEVQAAELLVQGVKQQSCWFRGRLRLQFRVQRRELKAGNRLFLWDFYNKNTALGVYKNN